MLSIIDINTARKLDSFYTILQLAEDRNIPIVAIQEPVTSFASAGQSTKAVKNDLWNLYFNDPTGRAVTAVSTRIDTKTITLHPSPHKNAVILQIDDLIVINIYQPPRKTDVISLIDVMVGPFLLTNPIIITGDFNARHDTWDETTNSEGRALATMADTLGLHLLTARNSSTFNAFSGLGHSTIDLTFINDLATRFDVQARNAMELNVNSDHIPQLITLDRDKFTEAAVRTILNWADVDWTAMDNKLAELLADVPSTIDHDHAIIDWKTERVQQAFQEAIRTLVPTKKLSPHSKPWWTTSLKNLRSLSNHWRRKYRKTKDNKSEPFKRYQEARKAYTRAVRDAIRQSAIKDIENFDETKLWKQVRALKNDVTPPGIPALQLDEGDKAITPDEKLDALVARFFPKPPTVDVMPAIPDNYESPHDNPDVTEAEILYHLKSIPSDCAMGLDGVPITILVKCWAAIRRVLVPLIQSIIQSGYHPVALRVGKSIALRKPGRRVATQTKDYRPITMLNALSKVIEKIVTARFASWLEPDMLFNPGELEFPNEQYGFRANRGCDQASAQLVNIIRQAKQVRSLASVAFLDISGAYDTVLPSMLIQQLQALRLPKALINWTKSFLTERSTQISIDGATRTVELEIGLPQGSPLSPILYAIYNSPAIKILKETPDIQVIVYADDIAIIACGPHMDRNCQKLEKAIIDMQSLWCIPFNQKLAPDKSVLVHFNGGMAGHDISSNSPGQDLAIGENSIIPAQASARHLGIVLDINLTFKEFILQRVTKLRQVTGGLTKIGYKHWGLSREFRIRAVQSVILPIVSFSAIAWAPFIRANQFDMLEAALVRALQWAFGMEYSTPRSSVFAESGFTPLRLYLTERCSITIARWRTLSHLAPLTFPSAILASYSSWNDRTITDTTVQNDIILLAKSGGGLAAAKRKIKIWDYGPIRGLDIVIPESKDAAWQAWSAFTLTANTTQVYTDGSKTATGCGAGIFIDRPNDNQHSFRLPPWTNIFQAEAFAIKKTIEDEACAGRHLHIFTDSWSVAQALQSFSNRMEPEIIDLRKVIKNAITLHQIHITIQWIPGHRDIPGNDRADMMAKAATVSDSTAPFHNIQVALSTLYADIRSQVRERWLEAWQKSARYVPKSLPYPNDLRRMREGLDLIASSLLTQFRVGHTELNWSRRRFKRHKSNQCRCLGMETSYHFIFECPLYADLRADLFNEIATRVGVMRHTLIWILDNPRISQVTVKFLKAANARRSRF